MKAIESVVFSDSVFKTADEEQVVRILNSIEGDGAKTFAVDSSTDIGLAFRHLAALWRFFGMPSIDSWSEPP